MAKKIADRARRLLDRPQPEQPGRSVEWSRFASKPQTEGQENRTKTGREIPKPERDRNMCR